MMMAPKPSPFMATPVHMDKPLMIYQLPLSGNGTPCMLLTRLLYHMRATDYIVKHAFGKGTKEARVQGSLCFII